MGGGDFCAMFRLMARVDAADDAPRSGGLDYPTFAI
jgi:hypothetical protein